MSGQKRTNPFHVYRDVIRDNLWVVEKLRLTEHAEIRTSKTFATVDASQPNASVNMPYAGGLELTVLNGGCNDVVVNNPFVSRGTLVVVDNCRVHANSGQFTLRRPCSGVHVITVGRSTNGCKNNSNGRNHSNRHHDNCNCNAYEYDRDEYNRDEYDRDEYNRDEYDRDEYNRDEYDRYEYNYSNDSDYDGGNDECNCDKCNQK